MKIKTLQVSKWVDNLYINPLNKLLSKNGIEIYQIDRDSFFIKKAIKENFEKKKRDNFNLIKKDDWKLVGKETMKVYKECLKIKD